MSNEFDTINKDNKYQNLKIFIKDNIKNIIIGISVIILLLLGYIIYNEYNNKKKIDIANKFNKTTISYISGNKTETKKNLIEIIYKKDKTYSPLALYFLIDNNIENDAKQINILFDQVIENSNLEKEIKNLLIYKKALFNAEFETENFLIKTLNPIINSESTWRSHALYLLGEYFYSKNEKKKSEEFFNRIMKLENSNPNIRLETQKRLNRDF